MGDASVAQWMEGWRAGMEQAARIVRSEGAGTRSEREETARRIMSAASPAPETTAADPSARLARLERNVRAYATFRPSAPETRTGEGAKTEPRRTVAGDGWHRPSRACGSPLLHYDRAPDRCHCRCERCSPDARAQSPREGTP